jgi:hypothetical protein
VLFHVVGLSLCANGVKYRRHNRHVRHLTAPIHSVQKFEISCAGILDAPIKDLSELIYSFYGQVRPFTSIVCTAGNISTMKTPPTTSAYQKRHGKFSSWHEMDKNGQEGSLKWKKQQKSQRSGLTKRTSTDPSHTSPSLLSESSVKTSNNSSQRGDNLAHKFDLGNVETRVVSEAGVVAGTIIDHDTHDANIMNITSSLESITTNCSYHKTQEEQKYENNSGMLTQDSECACRCTNTVPYAFSSDRSVAEVKCDNCKVSLDWGVCQDQESSSVDYTFVTPGAKRSLSTLAHRYSPTVDIPMLGKNNGTKDGSSADGDIDSETSKSDVMNNDHSSGFAMHSYPPVSVDSPNELTTPDLERVPRWFPKNIRKIYKTDHHGGAFTFKVPRIPSPPLLLLLILTL